MLASRQLVELVSTFLVASLYVADPSSRGLDHQHPSYISQPHISFRTCAQVEAIYFTVQKDKPYDPEMRSPYKIAHIRIATTTHVLPSHLSFLSPSHASARTELMREKPQVVTVEGPVEVQATETPLRINLAEADAEVTVNGVRQTSAISIHEFRCIADSGHRQ